MSALTYATPRQLTRQVMGGELRKITTLPSQLCLTALAPLVQCFLTWQAVSGVQGANWVDIWLQTLTYVQIFFIVIAVNFIATEFTSGQLLTSLALVPCRNRFLGGKALALLVWVLPLSFLTLILSFAVGSLAARQSGIGIGAGIGSGLWPSGSQLFTMLGAGTYLVLLSFLVASLTLIFRQPLSVLAVAITWTQLVSPIALQGGLGLKNVAFLFPDLAGRATFDPQIHDRLGHNLAVNWLVLLLWFSISMLAGSLIFRRRDVT